jgi:uncharacterized protein YbjT (DUF2867 family)
MKIVVIGGTGLIGSKTVSILRQGGHEVVAASPHSGINTVTGEGLKEALAGAQVAVDLANSSSFEDKAVLEFFETSGRNLLAAEAAAGVRHHVALSIVGTDRMPDNGYFRGKVAQEKLIKASGISYTIIRSTQFLEFLGGIADFSADGKLVKVSPGLFQPIAAVSRRLATRARSSATPRPDIGAAGSKSGRSCHLVRRASAISASTNGSAAHTQEPERASSKGKLVRRRAAGGAARRAPA